jgi:adenylate cyclase
MFQKAIALDPSYADAYAGLALTYFIAYQWQFSHDPHDLDRAFETAQHAIALDDSQGWAHGTLGRLYILKRQYDQAIAEAERAIEVTPNSAYAYDQYAEILNFSGRPAEAVRLRLAEKAIRLDPVDPGRDFNIGSLGISYALMGRYREAIPLLQRALTAAPNIMGFRLVLAYAYSESGDAEQARAEAAEIQRLSPQFSVAKLGERFYTKDKALLERWSADLRKAGLK